MAGSHARRALDARVVRARDGVRRTPVQFPPPTPPPRAALGSDAALRSYCLVTIHGMRSSSVPVSGRLFSIVLAVSTV